MPPPPRVVIPLLQHIGAIAEPRVKKGDLVKVGQVLGDSDKALSVPIHSSVSGEVTAVDFMLWAGGIQVTSVEIKTDGRQDADPDRKPPEVHTPAQFLEAVRASGLVGLGGAGFPTHVKLAPPPGTTIDTLVINAAECEPYITSDYREILENGPQVLEGIRLVLAHLKIPRCLIGIEDNKPEAIAKLKTLCGSDPAIRVVCLPTRYPQGAEKMLIWATTRRTVPIGALPADVGVIVMNVASVAFVAQYMKTGVPLIKKRVTVAGPCVKTPKNVEVFIGTPLADVFAFVGGFHRDPKKVIMGGPMMGIAQHSLETSVVKQTNALLAFDGDEGELPPATACLRCGRCVTACPMGLVPLELHRSALRADTARLETLAVAACIECGSCSYVCPAKIHLVQAIRLGKTQVKVARARAGTPGAAP